LENLGKNRRKKLKLILRRVGVYGLDSYGSG
jgi:hypothetical protein